MEDLESKWFYRLTKVMYVFFLTLGFMAVFVSWGDAIEWLAFGSLFVFLIINIIKQSLLYIVYGKEIVYLSEFISLSNLIRNCTIELFKNYPTELYFSGIFILCFLSVLLANSFSTLTYIWILAYPLTKLASLCKKSFMDKNYDAQEKLRNIAGWTVYLFIVGSCLGLYQAWAIKEYHYIWDNIIKYFDYIWSLFGYCFWMYVLWLIKKILVNKDREALITLAWLMTGIAVWAIIFFLYGVIKNMNFNVDFLWHSPYLKLIFNK